MDAEAVRKKRLEEIELKKKRLEEMRKSRATSAAEAAPAAAEVAPSSSTTSGPVGESKADDTDALVSALLAGKSSSAPVPVAAAPEQAKVVSGKSAADRIKAFTTVKSPSVIHILPAQAVSYDKECQTDAEDQSFLGSPSAQDDLSAYTPLEGFGSPKRTRRGGTSLSSGSNTNNAHNESVVKAVTKKVYTEEEKSQICAEQGFLAFLGTTSLYVERALEFTDSFDILRNYTSDNQGKDKKSESLAFEVGSSYEDEQLQGRPVMDVRWSSLVPELFLVAYGSKGTTLAPGGKVAFIHGEEESAGMVCVWSKDLHKRPELRFHAVSPVLAALFHNQESHLIIGGCYNGQILLWDMRTSSSLPVQRSSLTGKGHKHPVYSMALTGSTMANELVSISIDGLLCHWDISRLTEPISVVYLSFPSPSRNSMNFNLLQSPSLEKPNAGTPLNICCMAFGHTDTSNHIIVGSGSGQLLKSSLPYKLTDATNKQVDAHYGLVTSIQPHPSPSHKYKNLFLTSSLDWTVKLWNVHHLSEPIYEFYSPSCDYVSDVQWSPVHPAVFVTLTSTGKLNLWNMAKSVTEPVDSITVISEDDATSLSGKMAATSLKAGSSGHTGSPVALNKAMWAQDGLSLYVGDSAGVTHRIKLQQSFAIPSPAEESKLEMVLLAGSQANEAKENQKQVDANGGNNAGYVEEDSLDHIEH